jgi:hypothetical protein
VEVIRDSINAHLKGNATVLSSAILRTISVTFNTTGGAASLETEVSAAQEALTNMFVDIPVADKEAYLRSVLTRNPESTPNGPAAVTAMGCLPMKGGKSITFIFNLQVAAAVPPMPMYAGGSETDVTVEPAWNKENDKRRVAIIMHLGIKDMYFQRQYNQQDVTALTAPDSENEVFGSVPLRAFYAGLIPGLAYTLREAAAPDAGLAAALTDAQGAVIGATSALGDALETGAAAISTQVAGEIEAAYSSGAAYSPVHFVDPATTTAIAAYDSVIVDNAKSATEKDAARTAVLGALAADRYLSEANKEYIRNALQTAAAAVGEYRSEAIQGFENSIKLALVAFNNAVAGRARLAALSDYYTASYAAASAAQKLDREALSRPVATDSNGAQVAYHPTLTSGVFNEDDSVAQHPGTTTVSIPTA